MQGLTWTNATTMPVAKPGAGTLGTRTVIGLSRGFALYNDSLPTKTRLVMPAETGPVFSDDHVRHTQRETEGHKTHTHTHTHTKRERERERDTHTHTHTHTHRQTDRQTHTHTHRACCI
eukprot:COSAG05_NODE_606_length_8386_cov_17.739471_5_plen_119_part_00